MLIAYSTAEGELASDVGAGAGPYAKILAEEIVKPGIEAVVMFRAVQRRVRAAIRQEPYLGFSALGDVYLGGKPDLTVPRPAPVLTSTAAREWQDVKDTMSIAVLEGYLQTHKDDRTYAALAQERIDALKHAQRQEERIAAERREAEERARREGEAKRQAVAAEAAKMKAEEVAVAKRQEERIAAERREAEERARREGEAKRQAAAAEAAKMKAEEVSLAKHQQAVVAIVTPSAITPHAGSSLGTLFTEKDAELINRVVKKNQFKLPTEFNIEQPGNDIPRSSREFVGVWASEEGFDKNGRQAMIILGSVDSHSEATFYYLYGPPTTYSIDQIPSGYTKFSAPIVGNRIKWTNHTRWGENIQFMLTVASTHTLILKTVRADGRKPTAILKALWKLVDAESSANR